MLNPEVNHHEIRDELAKQLSDEIRLPDELVKTEHPIKMPYSSQSVRADVAIYSTPIVDFEGIAFEIKTHSDKSIRQEVLRQLHLYELGGYFPVLVADQEDYKDKSGSAPSLEWIVRHLGASYVEIVESDPLIFNLSDDRLPSGVGFPRILDN